MSINPSTLYSGQIDNSDPANYPFGRARNVTAPGDDTGTPLDENWVNDWLGFQQRLFQLNGSAPDDSPESATASQVLSELLKLSGREILPTGSDTFNTPAWVSRLKVTITGGGGGGALGGAASGDSVPGGGAGATETYYIDNPDPSYAYTVGAGAAQTAVVDSNGNSGEQSSFGAFTVERGQGATFGAAVGGAGGLAPPSVDTFQVFPGGNGTSSRVAGQSVQLAGDGGPSFWGSGGEGSIEGDGNSGNGYGSGGSGIFGAGLNSVGGRDGVIIVEWGFGI